MTTIRGAGRRPGATWMGVRALARGPGARSAERVSRGGAKLGAHDDTGSSDPLVPGRVPLDGSVRFVQVAAYPTLTNQRVRVASSHVPIVTGTSSRFPTFHGVNRVLYAAVKVGELATVRSTRSAVGDTQRVTVAHAPAGAEIGRVA